MRFTLWWPLAAVHRPDGFYSQSRGYIALNRRVSAPRSKRDKLQVRAIFSIINGVNTCSECDREIKDRGGRRRAVVCSDRCRKRKQRRLAAERAANPIPAEMRDRATWVRADDKRPIQPDGTAASSTNPTTWHSFDDCQQGAGNGMGIMLGNGLGCYDLDHVSDADARAFIATIDKPVVFCERSVSGRGVHVFVRCEEQRGRRRNNVEFYSRGRFIRVTGNEFAA